MTGLDTPLTPLRFLARAAEVYPDKEAIVDGERTLTYAEFAAGVTRLARALRASGVGPGDRVAYLAPNSAELLVAHFAVPLAGAVLVAINTRLAAEEIDYICDHSGSVLLFVDAEFARLALVGHASWRPCANASSLPCPDGPLRRRSTPPPPRRPARARRRRPAAVDGRRRARRDLDQLHLGHHRPAQGRHVHPPRRVPELARRGAPPGLHPSDSVYLWTLPMFHCNGWCTTWARHRGRRHPRLPARGARRRRSGS